MSDLKSLYQDIILDHQQEPRNFGILPDAQCQAEGFNPMCGDRILVQLKLSENGLVPRFTGEACSICIASASMMTEEVEGQSPEQARNKIEEIRDLMQGKKDHIEGDLDALSGVKNFPVRIKCALLPWIALKDALQQCKLKSGGEEK